MTVISPASLSHLKWLVIEPYGMCLSASCTCALMQPLSPAAWMTSKTILVFFVKSVFAYASLDVEDNPRIRVPLLYCCWGLGEFLETEVTICGSKSACFAVVLKFIRLAYKSCMPILKYDKFSLA